MQADSLIINIKAHLRLFRWENLFIVMLTMILVRYALIFPLIYSHIDGIPGSRAGFIALVLSSVFLAAGGNIINDYFDVKIDRINRPEKMILGRHVSFASALLYYQVFSVLGVLSGFAAGYFCGSWRLGGIPLVIAGLLYYYSFRYKRLFIRGTLVVSLLSAMVILIVWLFEFFRLQTDALSFAGAINGFGTVNRLIAGYFVFSFLLTFTREILKDVEDLPGDSRYGCQSIPVRLGIAPTLMIAVCLLALVFILLVLIQSTYLIRFNRYILIYSVCLIDLPLLFIIVRLIRNQTAEGAAIIQRSLKWLMLAGVVSMLFFNL
ncbi:MAG: geranylgeranylglycerol-phosphate geranylgeranyltransferase [Bacteroidetes bacterium]|nr:geranylgeranylglycerol-phosphate geranylgeranyltransferase [Bacteroidota bacterium]